MRHEVVGVVAGLVVAGGGGFALGQPAPLSGRVGGILIGDLTLDQIALCRDLSGDGDANDAGECTVFFDASNQSGLPGPTDSVFRIFQAIDRSIYAGNGGTDAVYRLRDLNGDRDAQDVGEAKVWFSAAGNAGGFDLSTPNGIWQADDGVYLLTAGTANTVDAIYRTRDLTGDGDAQDAGEATVWLNLQGLVADSSAFDLVFVGDTAFFTDTLGAAPDAILRARDNNGNLVIEAGEVGVYIDDTNTLGVQIGTGLVTDGVALYISESSSSAQQTIHRLVDLDGSLEIDDTDEVTMVWTEAQVPMGFGLGGAFGLAIGPSRDLAVGSAGDNVQDNVFRLRNLNADSDYLDPGETLVFRSGGGDGVLVDNPRALEFVLPKPGDVNGDDLVNVADLVAVVLGWGLCPAAPAPCPGDPTLDGIVNVQDLVSVVLNWD